MDYKELFDVITTRGSKLCYPFGYSSRDIDYLDFVLETIDGYLDLVDSLDDNSVRKLNAAYEGETTASQLAVPLNVITDAHKVARVVKEVLKECYRCYYDDAYRVLENFFKSRNYHYYKLLPQYRCSSKIEQFYRMRSDRKSIDIENPQGELFHIPYHLRHLASTQRYSIPGYPVLYLAGSFLTAWSELDKPRLQDVIYSKLRFIQNENFIDLAYPLSSNPYLWEYYSLFIFYPLMIACMVQVKHAGAPFKPEYCLPQQMLNIVRSIEWGNNIGIVYMSNKIPESESLFSFESRNFVVVVRDVLHRKGYDLKLATKLEMTEPIVFSDEDIDMFYTSCSLKELTNRKEKWSRFRPIVLQQE